MKVTLTLNEDQVNLILIALEEYYAFLSTEGPANIAHEIFTLINQIEQDLDNQAEGNEQVRATLIEKILRG